MASAIGNGRQFFAAWVENCPAEAFHTSARSLVERSDSGQLLALPVPKAYVYGEHSANPNVLAHLQSIPKYRIANCGHFVMIDKPAELMRIVCEVVSLTK